MAWSRVVRSGFGLAAARLVSISSSKPEPRGCWVEGWKPRARLFACGCRQGCGQASTIGCKVSAHGLLGRTSEMAAPLLTTFIPTYFKNWSKYPHALEDN
ncbi:CSEP0200 putative effector protein [Blumeria hordei DH14]|uniref:CSEP0200 putative effector protein n=1 Tax=Blumeria graminis f. sp. hordei (strain DH14) TaxID=546991 RepID=N1JNQ6_BLUG1|nr:CSEP0200 putative effector protein [Blumeria hordei DH14]